MPREEIMALGLLLQGKRDRRRKSAVERNRGSLWHTGEADRVAPLLHMDNAILDQRAVNAFVSHVFAVGSDEAEGDGNMHQLLAAFGRRWRHRLLDFQGKPGCSGVVRRTYAEVRCAGLMIP